MSRKRMVRGIKRIAVFVIAIGLLSGVSKWIINSIQYPEFQSSTAAYHAVYGDDRERLEILDEKAQEMGYENFNDYRVRTW